MKLPYLILARKIISVALIALPLTYGCTSSTEPPKPAPPKEEAKPTPPPPDPIKQSIPLLSYTIWDQKRSKIVGYLSTSKSIVKGDIIFLEDDCYIVTMVKIKAKDDGTYDGAKFYSTENLAVWVNFVGKSHVIKDRSQE